MFCNVFIPHPRLLLLLGCQETHLNLESYNYPLPSLLQIYPLTLISVILSTFLSKFSLSDLL